MPHKPTIVMVIPDLKGNGAERVVLTLATGFNQQGCDVHIVVFNKLVELASDKAFKIHEFKKHYRWIPKSIRGLILAPILDKFITKNCGTPDLVLSNLLPVDRILSRSRLNTYAIIHSTMSKEMVSFSRDEIKMSSIYTRMPCICVSKGVLADFTNTFNTTFDVRYIYNPVDIEFIMQKSVEFTPKYNNYLVHVGKFNNAKRHDILIRAYHLSNVKNPLVLVGQGPLKKECEELVNSLGLNEKVIFAGFKSNPYPLMKNAKLMVFSSEYEGLGLVILESLVVGTPVISTDCESGPREILPKNNLVPVNDIRALASKISDAVQYPIKYSAKVSRNFHLEEATSHYLNLTLIKK
jgi:glycosyltransferase involved in cell wall biosynthesis